MRKVRQAGAVLQRALDVGNDIELLDRAVVDASDIVGPMRGLFDYPHLPRELKQCKELRFKLQEWVDISDIRAFAVCLHYLNVRPPRLTPSLAR